MIPAGTRSREFTERLEFWERNAGVGQDGRIKWQAV